MGLNWNWRYIDWRSLGDFLFGEKRGGPLSGRESGEREGDFLGWGNGNK